MPYARCLNPNCENPMIDYSNYRGFRLIDLEHCKGYHAERLTWVSFRGDHPLGKDANDFDVYTGLQHDIVWFYAFKAKSGFYVRDKSKKLIFWKDREK